MRRIRIVEFTREQVERIFARVSRPSEGTRPVRVIGLDANGNEIRETLYIPTEST